MTKSWVLSVLVFDRGSLPCTKDEVIVMNVRTMKIGTRIEVGSEWGCNQTTMYIVIVSKMIHWNSYPQNLQNVFNRRIRSPKQAKPLGIGPTSECWECCCKILIVPGQTQVPDLSSTITQAMCESLIHSPDSQRQFGRNYFQPRNGPWGRLAGFDSIKELMSIPNTCICVHIHIPYHIKPILHIYICILWYILYIIYYIPNVKSIYIYYIIYYVLNIIYIYIYNSVCVYNILYIYIYVIVYCIYILWYIVYIYIYIYIIV